MFTTAYDTPEAFPDCARSEPRTNMFVMAALVTNTSRETAKVRNMSSGGALVEAAHLPDPGTPCLLHRGEISLDATVVWKGHGKAGIRFHRPADVGMWLPSGRRTQSEVDVAIKMAKAELVSAPAAKVAAPLFSTELSREDIIHTAAAMEALSDELADDPAVVARFMTKLQTLDIAAQTLRKLAGQMP
ncbi:PilZ domain-containing protein [Qipengyuania mesophila]|uniref:PilZ domain-containing protein n=1 Tax=Qipengyuania mesophila TaxID=2867246 RepID=UPI00351217AB